MTAPASVELTQGEARVAIAPSRGAIVTSIEVGGTALLYLDRATLDDPSKNVRGGIPLLFPFAGKLAGGFLAATGTSMGQHGFGRNRPWDVVEQAGDRLRLRLSQDGETRRQFPFDYDADYVVTALPRGLEAKLHVKNLGGAPVPLSPGWHPYFRCPAARKVEVRGDAPGFDAAPHGDDVEFDFGAVASASGRATFEIPGIGSVAMSFSPAMRHLQFWSLPGKDFICLEPFFGAADAINRPGARLEVPPGEARELWLRVELGAAAPST